MKKIKSVVVVFLVLCMILPFAGCLNANEVVNGGSSVKLSEIQDKDGNCVIQDFPSVEASKYVRLSDYKSLTVEHAPYEKISEEELLDNIHQYIAYFDEFDKVTEGVVKDGDLIELDSKGYLNGAAISSYTFEKQLFTVGKDFAPEGFSEHIVGAEIGKEFEFELEIAPTWSDASIAGKTVTFKMTVNSVNTYPEVTDDNVAEITNDEFTTKDEFVEYIRTTVDDYNYDTYKSEVLESVFSQLEENATFTGTCHELLVWFISLRMRRLSDVAKEDNVSLEEVIKTSYGNESVDDYIASQIRDNEKALKRHLIIMYIAQAEGLSFDAEADGERFDEMTVGIMESLDLYDVNAVYDYYKKSNIEFDIIMEKTLDWLVDHVTVVDPPESTAVPEGLPDYIDPENIIGIGEIG